MLFKIILFFNLVSLAMAIYMLLSYLKSKRDKDERKNPDDAI
ncbi:hypothetical protein [Flagellimonas aequoris]|nr:hypothetical protein [Allomuricauda aequoris]